MQPHLSRTTSLNLKTSLALGLLTLLGILSAGHNFWPWVSNLHLHVGWNAPTGTSLPTFAVFIHNHVAGKHQLVNVFFATKPATSAPVITWPTPSDFVVGRLQRWLLPLLTLWWLLTLFRLPAPLWASLVQTPPPRRLRVAFLAYN